MKETPTPRKDVSYRRPKDSPSTKSSTSDHTKKSHKVAKKNLNAIFSSVSEELLNDSEISSDCNNNHNGESIDSFEYILAGEEALTRSDSSASSEITTVKDDSLVDSGYHNKVVQSNICVDVEVVSNFLKQAKLEVSSSNDVSPVSKKLLDSLVEVSVREFCALPEDTELVGVLISVKTRVLVFCFAVWLITMIVILFGFRSSSGRSTSSFYLPPT